MKASRLAVTCTFLSLVFLFTDAAFAQDEEVTVGSILKNAKVPLSDEQTKKIKTFKLGGDFEMFRELGEMFNEKQTAALKEVLGSQPPFGGEGPEQPRFLFFVVIFENEECPFTKSQIAKLKDIPMGPEGFEQMRSVYNDKQNKVIEEMFSNFR